MRQIELRGILEELRQDGSLYCEDNVYTVHSTNSLNEIPLHVYATRGDVESGRLVLEGGSKLDIHGEHGYTPLHEAVLQGHIGFVKLLLEYGVDVTIKNDEGETSLDIARNMKYSDIISLFEDQ